MHSRLSLNIGLGIVALSLSALPASAHHGWGGNLDEEFEITGTVQTGVSLSGPHATMKIRASDGQISGISHWPRRREPNELA
jgi:hypothetical protein